jgi:pyruvate formate-lyase activating enzyme-like uncharacterized protein
MSENVNKCSKARKRIKLLSLYPVKLRVNICSATFKKQKSVFTKSARNSNTEIRPYKHLTNLTIYLLKEPRVLSPRANYTDRETAVCR